MWPDRLSHDMYVYRYFYSYIKQIAWLFVWVQKNLLSLNFLHLLPPKLAQKIIYKLIHSKPGSSMIREFLVGVCYCRVVAEVRRCTKKSEVHCCCEKEKLWGKYLSSFSVKLYVCMEVKFTFDVVFFNYKYELGFLKFGAFTS